MAKTEPSMQCRGNLCTSPKVLQKPRENLPPSFSIVHFFHRLDAPAQGQQSASSK